MFALGLRFGRPVGQPFASDIPLCPPPPPHASQEVDAGSYLFLRDTWNGADISLPQSLSLSRAPTQPTNLQANLIWFYRDDIICLIGWQWAR